jgi:cytochrome c peroxidase
MLFKSNRAIKHLIFTVLSLNLLFLVSGCSGDNRNTIEQIDRLTPMPVRTSSIANAIQPIPLQPFKLDKAVVALGELLFHDVRLSGDNTIACANCHVIDLGGTDNQKRSRGVEGRLGAINTPTVLNAALNFKQFWDGRVDTLEKQINETVNNKTEMNSNWPEVIAKLNADEALKNQFEQLFDEGITADNIRHAIATYERSLTTPNARFDLYLRGNPTALNAQELQGYALFKDFGCDSCHQGVNIGGNMFQIFGVMRNYFAKRGNITDSDFGQYNVTKLEQDRHKFKVPSLRNITLSAPYFHDGSAQTLEGAVSTMAYYQLGLKLEPTDISLLVMFLNTLTGEPYNKAKTQGAVQ